MNLSIASLGLFPRRPGPCRQSLSVFCVFFFFCRLILYVKQWRSRSWAGFLCQIPFVQVSFLSVICVNHITVSLFSNLYCHVSPATRRLAFPAPVSCVLLPNMAAKVPSDVTAWYCTLSPGYRVRSVIIFINSSVSMLRNTIKIHVLSAGLRGNKVWIPFSLLLRRHSRTHSTCDVKLKFKKS